MLSWFNSISLSYELHDIDVFLVLVPRDIKERGRDLDQVLNQYMYFVKPAFEEFCSPVSILVSWFISNTKHPQLTLLLAARHLNFTHTLAGLSKGMGKNAGSINSFLYISASNIAWQLFIRYIRIYVWTHIQFLRTSSFIFLRVLCTETWVLWSATSQVEPIKMVAFVCLCAEQTVHIFKWSLCN